MKARRKGEKKHTYLRLHWTTETRSKERSRHGQRPAQMTNQTKPTRRQHTTTHAAKSRSKQKNSIRVSTPRKTEATQGELGEVGEKALVASESTKRRRGVRCVFARSSPAGKALFPPFPPQHTAMQAAKERTLGCTRGVVSIEVVRLRELSKLGSSRGGKVRA